MSTRGSREDETPPRRVTRRSGRPPEAVRVEVRLTDPAINDLDAPKKSNRNTLRWALTKLVLLERDPKAGRPLRKELQGWRKLTERPRLENRLASHVRRRGIRDRRRRRGVGHRRTQ